MVDGAVGFEQVVGRLVVCNSKVGMVVVLEFIARNVVVFGRKIRRDEGFSVGDGIKVFIVYFYRKQYKVFRKVVNVDMSYEEYWYVRGRKGGLLLIKVVYNSEVGKICK